MDFNDSFLADPKPDGDDTIGSWPLSTEFPNSTANVVPGDRKEALPTSIPHEYEKENWENFFNAKTLITGNKLKLNDKAFEPPSCTVHPKENAHVVDSLLRSALTEIQFVINL